jgi:hypothetical protein
MWGCAARRTLKQFVRAQRMRTYRQPTPETRFAAAMWLVRDRGFVNELTFQNRCDWISALLATPADGFPL